MSDWYARRVAQATGRQAPPPPPPPAYPQHPAQGPQPVGYLADGTPIYNAPPAQPQPQGPGYPGQQQQMQPQPYSEQQMIEMARKDGTGVTPMDVLERAGARGGKGTKTETENCPECGSNQYFQRRGASKMGLPPAPYCHTCGYNGMYEQYGTMEPPVTPEG